MSPTEVAERHYAERQRLIRQIEREGVQAWRAVNRDAIAASWTALSIRVLVALIAAQTAAAGQAEGYTAAMLAELGIPNDPEGEVIPEGFAGEAADGRSLETLLLTPVVYARSELGRGQSLTQSMAAGQAALRLILRTEVADAGRVADGVAVAARPRIMYTRYARPPSCPRCAILAGRTYRYSQGFQRHPGCDCVMQPSTEEVAEDLASDPYEMFQSGQIRGLSKADAKAIEDGADINQVVNAHRGMYTAGIGTRGQVKLTTEGTTRRGIGSRSRRLFDPGTTEITQRSGRRTVRRVIRPRPEQIYRDAESRSDAIRLLRLHGYLR